MHVLSRCDNTIYRVYLHKPAMTRFRLYSKQVSLPGTPCQLSAYRQAANGKPAWNV